jgi:hypothetical protein
VLHLRLDIDLLLQNKEIKKHSKSKKFIQKYVLFFLFLNSQVFWMKKNIVAFPSTKKTQNSAS